MIRPDFQRATAISFVAHLFFLITALAIMGLRSPNINKVYTISLVSPENSRPTSVKKPLRRTPPPKNVRKQKQESPEERVPPAKMNKTALKKEDPQSLKKQADDAIEKLRQDQKAELKAQQAEKESLERLREKDEKQRLEALRNRLAAEGAEHADEQVSEDARNIAMSSYSEQIMTRIKDNWVFPDVGIGTRAEVSITVFVDGSIKINKILTPSGNRAFDQSVLKAVIKTGKVPPPPFGRREDIILNFIPVSK